MTISRVAVVGGGTMGSGIAEVCARNGCDTIVVEADAAFAEASQGRITSSVTKAFERGKIGEDQRDATLANLRYATDVAELADRQLVIEAIIESPPAKFDLFARLDAITPPDCLLASNTSSIAIVDIGASTARPEQVLGMHFFNPATVQPLVELINSEVTAAATIDAAESFARDVLGKITIRAKDRAGFVVNRLLVPYLLAAIEMLDRGQATREDIDAGMRGGCAHPMGPLELCDLIGNDTILLVAEVLYDEFKEPTYGPPPLLKRMVAAGLLGRKSGAGFYDYRAA
jgi:3-hydroxybutyryl-CoA dehydrogenase